MERKPLPEEVIEALDIKKGIKILDFGCGEGKYCLPIAQFVGEDGRIYALDKNKKELDKVRDGMNQCKLKNIVLLFSEGEINLPEESMDIVLLIDVMHHINDKKELLERCYRVLKPGGFISIFPHIHIKGEEIMDMVNQANLFILKNVHEKLGLYVFSKKQKAE